MRLGIGVRRNSRPGRSRSSHRTSIDMSIARYVVLLLGMLLSSLASWLMG